MDITHYKGMPYLSLIYCSPSRFTICERGVPEELLIDNDPTFRNK